MSAISTRQEAGNVRGAPAHLRLHTLKPSSRRIRPILQKFADAVICPRIERYESLEQLNAQRLVAAVQVINACPDIALDLAQMSKSAPRELPFNFTALDAFRILLDQLHTLERAPRMKVAA
ncbi:hypothetical protein [Pseudomonas aeruginosa]|uniref:hypothetical protein n=1 Tax=Pseudomonas aeruginosa TaxID=287 RepID=UPI002955502E|nr:hypothetical protein [Pseudomonas aeruginosa]MDV8059778.1 hypothetical protein [Pseudomonas aeruginosa]MDV8091341.1 hypothetical protein [Pseudomonas aeruginosa]